MVEDPEEVDVILLAILVCEPPHAENQHDCAAVAGKSALPDLEDLHKAFPGSEVIVETIEQAVSQTGSHERTDQERIKKRVKDVLVDFLPFEELREHPISQNETGDEQEAIPPYGEATYPDYLRIHVPMHCK